MNNVIVAQINGLKVKYQKEKEKFDFGDNEIASFHFDYEFYYKPFSQYILPEMMKTFKNNPEQNFKMYEHLIESKYSQALLEEMTEYTNAPADFLRKLSDDITNDFNKLIVAYKKTTEEIKTNFLNQFIKNRKKALLILLENSPELAFRTIARLKSPRLQFYLLNKLDAEFTNSLKTTMETYCWERILKLLVEYCFYPAEIDPKDYFNLWEGEQRLHIKFCRVIMGNRYERAKEFLKDRHSFYKVSH